MPYLLPQPFLVAAVQISPAFLDRDTTVDRACQAIAEAGSRGARLVVFPEAFVPGYPLWVWSIAAGQTQDLRALYAELLDQAVTIPSAAIAQLCDAARGAGVYVAIGVNERNVEASGTSLYNALLFIGADGRILGMHRKLVPTAGERLVHAQGDGSGSPRTTRRWGVSGDSSAGRTTCPSLGRRSITPASTCMSRRRGIGASHGCRRCVTSRRRDVST